MIDSNYNYRSIDINVGGNAIPNIVFSGPAPVLRGATPIATASPPVASPPTASPLKSSVSFPHLNQTSPRNSFIQGGRSNDAIKNANGASKGTDKDTNEGANEMIRIQPQKMEDFHKELDESLGTLKNENNSMVTITLLNQCRQIVKNYQRTKTGKEDLVTKPKPKPKPKRAGGGKRKMPHLATWQCNFKKLIEFRKKHNHCHVPVKYDVDTSLARWVKRQRYHYMLHESGKHSPITADRISALEKIGFIWSAQDALWMERVHDLEKFKNKYGHCSVPTIFEENQTLATWVKFQRRQYKQHRRGNKSYMTDKRIEILEDMGFAWKIRAHRNDGNLFDDL